MAAVKLRELDATAVADAATAIGLHIRRTPTEKSDALSGLAGREVHLKLEKVPGPFKDPRVLNAPTPIEPGATQRRDHRLAGNHALYVLGSSPSGSRF